MSGIAIARIFGFEIRIHPSWILILALIAVSVVGQLQQVAAVLDPPIQWLTGALVALAFLGSAVAHELGHAVIARRHGLIGGPVTVYFFGGSASFEPEADDPRAEAAIALAGPTVSLAVGAATLAIGAILVGVGGASMEGPATIGLVLGVLNLVLGAVNLVPAYPLDGGRLARAVAWARTGDPRAGSRIVVRSGRLIGWALLGAGLTVILMADGVDGLMLGAAGWFLASSATQVDRRISIEALLDGVRVGDVMERDVPTIPPQLTVDTFAERILPPASDTPTLPVVGDHGFVGLVAASRLRRLARAAWPTTRAAEIMVARPELAVLAPDESLWDALAAIRRSGLDGLPVVLDDGLLGVLTRRAIVIAIQERQRVVELP